MRKWEYKVVVLEEKIGGRGHAIGPEEEGKKLNFFGQEGWELVSVIPAVGADPHSLISNSRAYLRKEIL